MNLKYIFLAFMALVGVAAGVALIMKPELRDARIAPYFWIVLAMAVFELGLYARAGAVVLGMDMRVLGFLIGVVLMAGIPVLAGSPGRLF